MQSLAIASHRLPLAFTALILATCLVACGGDSTASAPASASGSEPAAQPDAATQQPSGAADAPAADAPAPDAPALMTSRTPAAGDTIDAPGAQFTLPADWRAETPSSSMRLAQAVIPGSAGEGQLTVFYFGPGGGGGVDPNIDRWIGQMEIDPGVQPTRETFENGAFRITWVEVEGTIQPSTMGTGPTEAQPGSRLLGAVVEGAEGPWFFKATGPSATLAEQREAFLFMVKSAHTP